MNILSPMTRILFLCTGNSCRSQMAEGFARAHKSARFEAYSAGVAPHGLDPKAVEVMAEVGIDITSQKSTHVDQLRHIPFDWVVTVCDHAAEQCPVFPGRGRVIHRAFDDPPKLARNARNREEGLVCYRRVRDEIGAFIETLPEGLGG